MLEETQALLWAAEDELMKSAWIARAHRELRKRGLCSHEERGVRVKVRIELDLQVDHGHPAQVLALLHDRLPGLLVIEKDGVLAHVEHVEKVEVG